MYVKNCLIYTFYFTKVLGLWKHDCLLVRADNRLLFLKSPEHSNAGSGMLKTSTNFV